MYRTLSEILSNNSNYEGMTLWLSENRSWNWAQKFIKVTFCSFWICLFLQNLQYMLSLPSLSVWYWFYKKPLWSWLPTSTSPKTLFSCCVFHSASFSPCESTSHTYFYSCVTVILSYGWCNSVIEAETKSLLFISISLATNMMEFRPPFSNGLQTELLNDRLASTSRISTQCTTSTVLAH